MLQGQALNRKFSSSTSRTRRTSFEVYVFLHFLRFFEVEIHQKALYNIPLTKGNTCSHGLDR